MYDYRIAIIDDNQAVLKTLKLVLKGVFVSVVTLPHPNSLPALLAGEKVDVVLLEGIVLQHVQEGRYFLSAAPLNLAGCDGAPCRAVLIKPTA